MGKNKGSNQASQKWLHNNNKIVGTRAFLEEPTFASHDQWNNNLSVSIKRKYSDMLGDHQNMCWKMKLDELLILNVQMSCVP